VSVSTGQPTAPRLAPSTRRGRLGAHHEGF